MLRGSVCGHVGISQKKNQKKTHSYLMKTNKIWMWEKVRAPHPRKQELGRVTQKKKKNRASPLFNLTAFARKVVVMFGKLRSSPVRRESRLHWAFFFGALLNSTETGVVYRGSKASHRGLPLPRDCTLRTQKNREVAQLESYCKIGRMLE